MYLLYYLVVLQHYSTSILYLLLCMCHGCYVCMYVLYVCTALWVAFGYCKGLYK